MAGERPGSRLRWHGVLADASDMTRLVAAGMLAIACVTPAVTQWGFVGVQFASGATAYLIFLLAPVALTSMLLGMLPGTGMGLFAGAMMALHAAALPLDYYELTYVQPVGSIVAMALYGLLAGALFAAAVDRGPKGVLRGVKVVMACLLASLVFSVGFGIGVAAVGSSAKAGGGASGLGRVGQLMGLAVRGGSGLWGMAFQVLGDALVTSVAALAGLRLGERGVRVRGDIGLRGAFGVRLSAAVLTVFMVMASVGYVAVTIREFDEALVSVRSEARYLFGQAERTSTYNTKVVRTLLGIMGDSDETWDSIFELTSGGGLLSNLIDGYSEADDGVVVVTVTDYVVATNADRLDGAEELSDIFDDDILEAIDRSIAEGTFERVIYEAPSVYNDLIDLSFGRSADNLSSMLTSQVGYVYAVGDEHFQVILVRPASMVFAGRSEVMGWLGLSSLATLVIVYLLAWYLLDVLVARRVDAINETLAAIAGGDLAARSLPEGTHEFVDLSEGVNTTVSALQEWIAEAESRMDAELATAKAIQEAALPGVFPPYPDILRFDIFASMDAAKEVGGDFYDFFLVGDDATPTSGRLAFVVADVSGKGVPAALFMMKAKTQIRDYLASGMELGEAMENANHQLCEGNDAGMFVTAWVGVLDYATLHVEFVNAGHNPPLLWQGGQWRWLRERSGLPLGLFDGMPYRTHGLDCALGDQLLLYTDGVTEAFSASEEQYGESRLERLVNESSDLHPRELSERVRRSVAQYAEGAEQSDDITIMALEMGVPPEEKSVLLVPAQLGELTTVNEFIHAELDRRLAPVRAQRQLDIAVEELFVNVCNYAYEDMPADVDRNVRVTCSYSADPISVTVELIDEGIPWDPLAKPDARRAGEYASMSEVPIGGLGILMAKRNVDEMRYERAGDSNVTTLVKRW